MEIFATIVAATEPDLRSRLLAHPLIEALRGNAISMGHYVAYLRETYHLVRHTPRIYARAASRVADHRPELRDWFLTQASEESGHDQLCVADLRRLAVDVETVLGGRPGAGAWGLITHDYFFANEGMPAALLGSASFSEYLGAFVAGPVIQALEKSLALPSAALGFIRSHGAVDRQHFDETRRAIEHWVLPDEVEEVIHARRMAIEYAARLLTDVLENPDESVLGAPRPALDGETARRCQPGSAL
jgi:pyrroloquinoline quinone (PQQ) biosynthesis protein C